MLHAVETELEGGLQGQIWRQVPGNLESHAMRLVHDGLEGGGLDIVEIDLDEVCIHLLHLLDGVTRFFGRGDGDRPGPCRLGDVELAPWSEDARANALSGSNLVSPKQDVIAQVAAHLAHAD